MPRSTFSSIASVAGLAATACTLSLLAGLVPACSRTVVASYPGNNAVRVPWRSCGMPCEAAFQELSDSHDATGKDCEDLVSHAENTDGSDPRVAAAALYDSAILLILRGKDAEASARFAKAEALDADPEYLAQQHAFEDAAKQYPPTLATPAAPATAAAPTAPAPTTTATPAPP